MLSLFVISAAFLAVAAFPPVELTAADYKPKPCCFPKQWQSNVFMTMGIASLQQTTNKATEMKVNSTIYFDSIQNRISEKLMVYQDGRLVMNGFIIILVNPQGPTTMYTVFPETRQCNKTTTASYDIDQFKCIPKNATFQGIMTLGYGDKSFPVQSWEYNMMETFPYPVNVKAQLLVEPERCTPIIITEYGSVYVPQPQAAIISAYHSNFYPKVKDPSVFEPPKYCRKDSLNNQMMVRHSVSRRFVR